MAGAAQFGAGAGEVLAPRFEQQLTVGLIGVLGALSGQALKDQCLDFRK